MICRIFQYINSIHDVYMKHYIDCHEKLDPLYFNIYFSETND